MLCAHLSAALAILATLTTAAAQTPVVNASGENMRLQASSVQSLGGTSWRVTLTMSPDNGNGSLPSSYRRWWHCRIGNLGPGATTTLQIRVSNAGYSDVILPAWSQSTDGGASFGPWTRVPTSATPTVAGSTHSFTLQVPAGVTDIALAKYFPYTVSDKDAFLARVGGHPSGHVRSIQSIGASWQGRPIELIELTDASVPDDNKRRVWIHAGAHPAENTSYFVVEGLVDFLLSGDPLAEGMLDALIFDIVPMANPDGVFLGNYRTNSRSINLETEWTAPYTSIEREVIALRSKIEQLMGSAQNPGANPIEVLFNLHSSHNVSYPFHFQHVSNSGFSLTSSRSGVIPVVNQKEGTWIARFRARSPFVGRGSTQSSTLSAPTRPFVESMMHDRWSIDPQWTGAPLNLEEVMAITYEGTYGRGPDGITWNTPDDYRRNGDEMARALADYFGVQPAMPMSSITAYGASCAGPSLTGNFLPSPDRLVMTVLGGASNAPAALVLGTTRTTIPLFPPTNCPLLTEPAVLLPTTTLSGGFIFATVPLPALAFTLNFQYVVVDVTAPMAVFQTTNALAVTFFP